MIEVLITKKANHNPPYLAQWEYGGCGHYTWFPTQKEFLEYFGGWDAELRPTNFEIRRKTK